MVSSQQMTQIAEFTPRIHSICQWSEPINANREGGEILRRWYISMPTYLSHKNCLGINCARIKKN